ncbi:MAG: hypothetical protein DMF23_02280 [Verrucomicrobia bacterium]|nr:MAG: hypothetical protein DMF23_02280 [Verrucomicrobiota bacterium]
MLCEPRFECDGAYLGKFRYPARHRLLGGLFLVDASYFTTANIVLKELQQQARTIEELSKEEHEILKELHPTVQKIDENVDKVKESTEA